MPRAARLRLARKDSFFISHKSTETYMDKLVLNCPICRLETVQIAPGVYQCGRCGYGPSTQGYRGYYCFADVEMYGDEVHALCFRYKSKKEGYVVTAVTWFIDEAGKAFPGKMGVTESLLGYEADPANFPNLPLPIVVLSSEKWDMPPDTPCLTPRMFSNPLGEKIRVLINGQPGTSGSRPFLTEPAARFPAL